MARISSDVVEEIAFESRVPSFLKRVCDRGGRYDGDSFFSSYVSVTVFFKGIQSPWL